MQININVTRDYLNLKKFNLINQLFRWYLLTNSRNVLVNCTTTIVIQLFTNDSESTLLLETACICIINMWRTHAKNEKLLINFFRIVRCKNYEAKNIITGIFFNGTHVLLGVN